MTAALPKILIVDDDHDTLDQLEIILYRSYDVLTAMNGFEALARVQKESPSLVMTDIKMPVMDGIRFFNSLRKQEPARQIPVIAVTSFLKEHSLKSLLTMGFTAVITKPPDAAAVVAAVGKILPPADNAPPPPEETRRKT